MLKRRIITAILLALGVLVLLFKTDQTVWRWALLGLAMVGAWEWTGFAQIRSFTLKLVYVLSVFFISFILSEAPWREDYLYSAFPLLGVMLWGVMRYQKQQGEGQILSPVWVAFIGVWVLSLFTVSMVLLREWIEPSAILLTMLSIWAIDTGAYFSGKRFGRTKLAVYVSPGKTWEGVLGGALLSFGALMIGGMALDFPLHISSLWFAILATLIVLLSVFGDLFQSVLKRQAGLKDSGKILPGHGGILDRIDSLLLAMPLFTLLWMWGLA